MPSPRAQPLRTRLLLLVALGLVPIALAGAWGIHAAIDQQHRAVERSMLDLSRALATAVGTELDATLAALATLSRTPPLASGDARASYALARAEADARPHWAGLVLTDARGQVLWKTAQPADGAPPRVVDPASLEQVLRTGRPAVGTIVRGQSGAPAVAVRWPLLRDGQLSQVLTAALKPDRLVELLARQHVPDSWVIAVYDAAGLRVARSRDQAATVARPPTASLAALLAAGGEFGTGLARTVEGDETYTGYARVPGHGWTVVVGAPTAPTRAALARTLAWYGAGLAASVLVCALLALRVARRIGTAVRTVHDQALRLGEGQPVAVAPSGIAEIDAMAHALVAASERLGASAAAMHGALARADAAARAKDEFMAMLGHELRNPLSPIVNAHKLLARTQPLDPRGQAALAMAERQAAQLRRLVDDLLDVTRIAQGKIVLQRRALELGVALGEACEAIEAAVAERGLRLQVAIDPSVGTVQADAARLAQVLDNLLGNALKFTPAGGLIAVRAHGDADGARVEIADSGIGIAPEHLESIFEPFTQVDATLDRAAGGLGIGLAWVRAIVQMHGGQVRAASPGKGQGATFTLWLPREARPRDAAPAASSAPRSASRPLVATDDAPGDAAA